MTLRMGDKKNGGSNNSNIDIGKSIVWELEKNTRVRLTVSSRHSDEEAQQEVGNACVGLKTR